MCSAQPRKIINVPPTTHPVCNLLGEGGNNNKGFHSKKGKGKRRGRPLAQKMCVLLVRTVNKQADMFAESLPR